MIRGANWTIASARSRGIAAPQWGKFTAPKMVCHLAESLKMAMGDLTVAPKDLPIRYPPLKQLIIYWRAVSEGRADRARAAGARAA